MTRRVPLQPTRKENNWENGKNDGKRTCNSADGTGQMAQPWMFMIMKITSVCRMSLSKFYVGIVMLVIRSFPLTTLKTPHT
jgi:hypothetical protein